MKIMRPIINVEIFIIIIYFHEDQVGRVKEKTIVPNWIQGCEMEEKIFSVHIWLYLSFPYVSRGEGKGIYLQLKIRNIPQL